MEYDKSYFYENYPCLIQIHEPLNDNKLDNENINDNNNFPTFLHKKIKLEDHEKNKEIFNELKIIFPKKANKKELYIQIYQNEFIKLREKIKTLINFVNNSKYYKSVILSYIYSTWNYIFNEELYVKTFERLNSSLNYILEDNELEIIITKNYTYLLFIIILVYECFNNCEIFFQTKNYILKILTYQLKAQYYLINKEFLKYGYIMNKSDIKLGNFFKFIKNNFGLKNPIYKLYFLYKELKTISIESIKKFCEENIFFTQIKIDISFLNNNKINNNNISIPYINNPPTKKFSLVLDLDETLIHFSIKNKNEGQLFLRPYLTSFLLSVSEFYEIIIFTAGMKEYANLVLDIIEKKIGKKIFDYKLFREHTFIDNSQNYIKDLSKIGRNLENILIIDNTKENFVFQPENGILISSFIIDNNSLNIKQKDKCLLELKNLLLKIVKKDINDLREEIKKNQEFINKKISLI